MTHFYYENRNILLFYVLVVGRDGGKIVAVGWYKKCRKSIKTLEETSFIGNKEQFWWVIFNVNFIIYLSFYILKCFLMNVDERGVL